MKIQSTFIPKDILMEARAVMNKAFDILRKELSVEEYLIYLQAITPKVGTQQKSIEIKQRL